MWSQGLHSFDVSLGACKYGANMEILYFIEIEELQKKVNGRSGKPILAKSGQIACRSKKIVQDSHFTKPPSVD